MNQTIRSRKHHSGQDKIKWMRRQKPLKMVFCVLLAAVMTLGGTMAWFTSMDSKTNSFNTKAEYAKDFVIVVVDEFVTPPDPPEPGETVYKSVGAQNIGTKPGFVRLLVVPVFVAADGTLLPAAFDTHIIIEDLNATDWVDGGDGYFYYTRKLSPGESTNDVTAGKNHNLFNSLHLADDIPDEYKNATLRIEVKCEAAGVANYREGWWGISNAAPPTSPTLITIDTALQRAQ